MDILLVLLRLLHIISAFAWVGLGAASTFYIAPAAIAAGESGLRFLKTLFTRTSFGSVFAAAAGVTTLAGILLYLFGNVASHFSQTGNIVLGIGAVAGILATLHGGAATGRATRALGEALAKHVPDDNQPIAASALTELRGLAEKLASHSRISMVLMIIALIGMGSARYL
jgi:hypothetical protein